MTVELHKGRVAGGNYVHVLIMEGYIYLVIMKDYMYVMIRGCPHITSAAGGGGGGKPNADDC